MNDLILRAAAIEHMKAMAGCATCNNYNEVRCRACEWNDAMDIVDEAPAVDAVPVVRCRDCEFYGEEPYGTLKECYRGCGWTKPIDYCSRGKRRESE